MAMSRPKMEVPKPKRIQRRPKDLRDEFAMVMLDRVMADAMDEYNAGASHKINDQYATPAEFSAWVCYQVADAMMTEREKNHEAD